MVELAVSDARVRPKVAHQETIHCLHDLLHASKELASPPARRLATQPLLQVAHQLLFLPATQPPQKARTEILTGLPRCPTQQRRLLQAKRPPVTIHKAPTQRAHLQAPTQIPSGGPATQHPTHQRLLQAKRLPVHMHRAASQCDLLHQLLHREILLNARDLLRRHDLHPMGDRSPPLAHNQQALGLNSAHHHLPASDTAALIRLLRAHFHYVLTTIRKPVAPGLVVFIGVVKRIPWASLTTFEMDEPPGPASRSRLRPLACETYMRASCMTYTDLHVSAP